MTSRRVRRLRNRLIESWEKVDALKAEIATAAGYAEDDALRDMESRMARLESEVKDLGEKLAIMEIHDA